MHVEKDNKINFIGEFSDKELEKEFFQQDIESVVGYIKLIVLVLGVINTLFVIPDYFLVQDRNAFLLIVLYRIIFIISVFLLFISIKKIKNYKYLEHFVTVYEMVGFLLFLLVFYEYENPDYLIQCYGVMILILAVFMVPNRWINMIGVSLFIVITFNLFYFYYMENVNISEFYAGIVYSLLVLMLSSVFAYRNSRYKRIHYFDTKELIRLSTTDSLTGIYNRAKFNEEFKQYVCLSKKNNTSLSVIIIDFDDFKGINDTYGHLIGDYVLVECSNLIKKNIRESDIFARWGGEEFVLVLPDMDIKNAFELGERLRGKIENHEFDKELKITCSFGIAELSIDDDTRTILQKADQTLYAAKNSGKNKVMLYQPSL